MVLVTTGLIIYALGKTVKQHVRQNNKAGGCNNCSLPALDDAAAPATAISDDAAESPALCPSRDSRKGVPDVVLKLVQKLQERQKARLAERGGGGNGRPKFRRMAKAENAEAVVRIGWNSVEGTETHGGQEHLPIGALVTDEIAWYALPASLGDWWNSPFREYKQRSLRSATQNFASQIGVGGYSEVYHGMLPNGMHVAVKVTSETPNSSSRSEDHFNRWLSELKLARQCEHRHVLTVLGYSYQKKKASKPMTNPFRRKSFKMDLRADLGEPASPFKGMQVLEFMENGDLAAVLESDNCSMDWSTRLDVLVGAATGLTHIHSQGIVHRDIKPHNVFLDSDYCPKIGDFGISKSLSLLPLDSPSSTSTSSFGTSLGALFSAGEGSETDSGDFVPPICDITAAKGTIGYLDPDYLSTGILTLKSDVFSFGVTILNVVSGKKAYELADLEDDKRAKALLQEGRVGEIIDPRLGMTSQELIAQATNVIRIAFLCMQRSTATRPRMEQVVALLTAVRDSQSRTCDLLECLWEEFTRSKYDFTKDLNSILDQQLGILIPAQLEQPVHVEAR